MHPILKLAIAGLISLHQYIPSNSTNYRKYYEDVRNIKPSEVFPAANQTCQYLLDTGLSVFVSSSNGEAIDNSDLQGVASILDPFALLKHEVKGKYEKRLESYGLSEDEVFDFLEKVCELKFSGFEFSATQAKEVWDFFHSDINVLRSYDLNGFGNLKPNYIMFDRTGKETEVIKKEDARWINFNSIPPHLILSLLFTEDGNFFNHEGIDVIALLRIAKQVEAGGRVAGSSTLTMQLLKNMYFLKGESNEEVLNRDPDIQNVFRKVREVAFGKIFENNHFYQTPLGNKKRILEIYLNLVNFGSHHQGIDQASQAYFSKEPEDLSLAESAYLVALLKAPNKYSKPSQYERLTKPRRDYIINLVFEGCSDLKTNLDRIERPKWTDSQRLRSDLCKKTKKIYATKEDIEEEIKVELPLWERSPRSPLSQALLPVERQVQRFMQSFKINKEAGFKEMEVTTTINNDLQKVVFNAVREKLLEYDEKEHNISKVQPARDDNANEAIVSREDIPWWINSDLRSLISQVRPPGHSITYSIRLNTEKTKCADKKARCSHSITREELKNLLTLHGVTNEDNVKKNLDSMFEKLNEKSSHVGDVTFIELDETSFYILPLKAFLGTTGKEKLDDEDITRLQSKYHYSRMQEQIYQIALSEMNKIRGRSYVEATLFTSAGDLIDEDLNSIYLSKDSRAQFEKIKKEGRFYWVRKNESTGAYDLQREKLQAGVLIMDPHTGEVLASFDGFIPGNTALLRSTQSDRQIGSTLKPFTYLYSIDKKGFLLNTPLNNKEVSIQVIEGQKPYEPDNFSTKHEKTPTLSLLSSLIHSQNKATVSLLLHEQFGYDWESNLLELLGFYQKMGIYESYENTRAPSLLLGAKDTTLSKILSAYSYFANGERVVKPQWISSIKDHKGTTLYQHKIEGNFIDDVKANSFYQMQALLLQIANRGTAARLKNFVLELDEGSLKDTCFNGFLEGFTQSCFAGKTGTVNEGKTLWFVGLSKNFAIGVWVGYDHPEPIASEGSKMALPIFQAIVEQGLEFLPPIEPLIESIEQEQNKEESNAIDLVPFSLDKITLKKQNVYGIQGSCHNDGSDAPYAIYIPEEQNFCQAYSSCWCSRFIDEGGAQKFAVNISYDAGFLENYEIYDTEEACIRDQGTWYVGEEDNKVFLCQ